MSLDADAGHDDTQQLPAVLCHRSVSIAMGSDQCDAVTAISWCSLLWDEPLLQL